MTYPSWRRAQGRVALPHQQQEPSDTSLCGYHDPIFASAIMSTKAESVKCSGWAVAMAVVRGTLGSRLACIYANMVNTHAALVTIVLSFSNPDRSMGFFNKVIMFSRVVMLIGQYFS